MGTLVSEPFAVTDGEEYTAWLSHLTGECERLRDEGRLPADDGVSSLLDYMRRLLHTVRADVARARASGESTVVAAVHLSATDYERTQTLSDNLKTLLEILEMRQAVSLQRGVGAVRVADAIRSGSFTS